MGGRGRVRIMRTAAGRWRRLVSGKRSADLERTFHSLLQWRQISRTCPHYTAHWQQQRKGVASYSLYQSLWCSAPSILGQWVHLRTSGDNAKVIQLGTGSGSVTSEPTVYTSQLKGHAAYLFRGKYDALNGQHCPHPANLFPRPGKTGCYTGTWAAQVYGPLSWQH